MWKIIDANGVIHQGSFEEMREAWDFMTQDLVVLSGLYAKYNPDEMHDTLRQWRVPWIGMIELVHVEARYSGNIYTWK